MTEDNSKVQRLLDSIPPHYRLFLAVAGFVVVPALVNSILTSLGYSTLGTIAWIIGYIGGAIFVWYYWLRHIEFLGSHAHEAEDPNKN